MVCWWVLGSSFQSNILGMMVGPTPSLPCYLCCLCLSMSHAIYVSASVVSASFLWITVAGLFHKYVNPLTITILTHEAFLSHLVSADGLANSTLEYLDWPISQLSRLNITCKKIWTVVKCLQIFCQQGDVSSKTSFIFNQLKKMIKCIVSHHAHGRI